MHDYLYFSEQHLAVRETVRAFARDEVAHPLGHVDATVEQPDMIATRWTATMVHSGDGFGIPATGQRVTVTGMSMARLRDGVMVEGWNNWDTMALMQQISPQPAPVELVVG